MSGGTRGNDRERTELAGVVVFDSPLHQDRRGWFRELFKASEVAHATGGDRGWPQDNISMSRGGVVRGLHYQLHPPQGKLVMCVAGEIFDVVVDLRTSSGSFGHWTSNVLSQGNGRSVWIPEGFGHGFLVTSDEALVLYKVTAQHNPDGVRVVAWNDPTLGIVWPLTSDPILSANDANAPILQAAELPD